MLGIIFAIVLVSVLARDTLRVGTFTPTKPRTICLSKTNETQYFDFTHTRGKFGYFTVSHDLPSVFHQINLRVYISSTNSTPDLVESSVELYDEGVHYEYTGFRSGLYSTYLGTAEGENATVWHVAIVPACDDRKVEDFNCTLGDCVKFQVAYFMEDMKRTDTQLLYLGLGIGIPVLGLVVCLFLLVVLVVILFWRQIGKFLGLRKGYDF